MQHANNFMESQSMLSRCDFIASVIVSMKIMILILEKYFLYCQTEVKRSGEEISVSAAAQSLIGEKAYV